MSKRTLHIALANEKGQVPRWIHLVPGGVFSGRDGRGPWRLSSPESFIAATAAHQAGADIPVDYEHQIELAEKNGQPAPAAGWVKGLVSRPDGIWGRVEWTPGAANMLLNKEYRYVSPVFIYDEKTGELIRLDSAALVGKPNLALKALNKQGVSMEGFLAQLAALLGLAEGATQEEIYAAVQTLTASGGDSANSAEGDQSPEGEAAPENLSEAEDNLMEAVADLVNKAEEEAGVTPAANKKTSPAAVLPGAQRALIGLSRRVAELEHGAALNRAELLVGGAMKSGKITPGMKPWALNYAKGDPGGFAKYIEAAPVVVAPGRGAGEVAGFKTNVLNQEEKAVCRQLGLAEDDYLSRKGS